MEKMFMATDCSTNLSEKVLLPKFIKVRMKLEVSIEG